MKNYAIETGFSTTSKKLFVTPESLNSKTCNPLQIPLGSQRAPYANSDTGNFTILQ